MCVISLVIGPFLYPVGILCSDTKKKCTYLISALSAAILPLGCIHRSAYRDRGLDVHPGWRLVPVADESRHDGSEACNVIYRAGLTFQIQSGTLITDENLRQEIALIANENLVRHMSTGVCAGEANAEPVWTRPYLISGNTRDAIKIDKSRNSRKFSQ